MHAKADAKRGRAGASADPILDTPTRMDRQTLQTGARLQRGWADGLIDNLTSGSTPSWAPATQHWPSLTIGAGEPPYNLFGFPWTRRAS